MKQMYIEISNGNKSTYLYKDELLKKGFVFRQGKIPKWTKCQTINNSELRNLKKYCRQRDIKITTNKVDYIRSNNYRENFFKIFKGERFPHKNKYRCAYCGKFLSQDNTTVDHIIPINGIQLKKRYRLLLRILGAKNVNSIQNLTPACSKCNSKKGTKGGKWIWKGYTGKTSSCITLRRFIRLFIIIVWILNFYYIIYRCIGIN